MSPLIASLVYAAAILALFALDHDRKVRTSKALWLPVIWIWIVGSRPISAWLGIGSTLTVSQMSDGSPIDALVFAVLLAPGTIVLIRRRSRTSACLKANWPVLIYFGYCLLSVLWSDFPDIAFKRWIKATGDLVMVLIIVTDADAPAALRRFFSRTGFILLPASVFLIKYLPDLGRGYDPWFGTPMNTGVTTNKNSLGVITFVLSLGALWRVLKLLSAKGEANRGRHLLAQGTLVIFGLALLVTAHSATSGACFALGSLLMIASGLPVIRRRPAAVHAFISMLVFAGGLTILLGAGADVAHAMGRNATLTGRTQIWAALIPMAPNPIVGAGFESFWVGPRVEAIWRAFKGNPLNEAHNGYIEVYLNLGWVGICLLALMLISGYRRATTTFRRDPAIGSLLLAFVATAAIYGVTEAGFRMLLPTWIFFLLGVVGGGMPQRLLVRTARTTRLSSSRESHSASSESTTETFRPIESFHPIP